MKTQTLDSAPANLEAEIDFYLSKAQQTSVHLAASQKNIERLRVETQSMLDSINSTLDKMAAR